jgi:hypothetical protein
MKTTHALALFVSFVASWSAAACHDDHGDGGLGSNTGSSCESPDECFPDVADGGLVGDPICLDRVEGGYCTHTCTADTDCCAAEGECPNDLDQVCAPFESAGEYYCFLSCEVLPDGYEDSNAYCQEFAHPDFICRSTGGGSDNRKVCVP